MSKYDKDSIAYEVDSMQLSSEMDVVSTNVGVAIFNKENHMLIHISQVGELIKKLQTVLITDNLCSILGHSFEDRFNESSIEQYKKAVDKLKGNR